jgi:hypothetical protein
MKRKNTARKRWTRNSRTTRGRIGEEGKDERIEKR